MSAPGEKKRAGSDRLLIERFSERIDGFNRRRQSLADLYALCERHEIEVVPYPMRRLHGGAVEEEGFKYIYVNRLLPGPEQVISGFHEFVHFTDHVLKTEIFKSTGNLWNLPKYERQAQLVGVLCWMPAPEIEGKSVEQLMREFGVTRSIARFRLSLLLDWRTGPLQCHTVASFGC